MPGPAPKLNVLVIDEGSGNGEQLERRLAEADGWQIEAVRARDEQAALATLRQGAFDVAFLDFGLPGSDGVRLLERIRQLYPKVVVIVTSAKGSEKDAVDSMRRGAIDYLTSEDVRGVDMGRLLRRAIEVQELQTENSELRQVSRMKDEFIASVSHELRTPLAVILGYAKTMEDGGLGPLTPDQATAVRAIRRRGERLLEMLNRLLAFKETEQGAQVVLRPLDLAAFLRELAASGWQELHQPASVECSAGQEPVWVLADHSRLREAVLGLVSNAVKFSPAGAAVSIRLERRPQEAWVQIRDGGRGIPPEVLSRVFESFFHADKDLTREVSGLGIGLALTRQIVELHGGRVWLESEGPGKGTTATLVLPLVEPDAPRVVVEHEPRVEKRRILVVEDNDEIVDIVRLFLAGLSENLLLTATDRGERGLELLTKERFDLLLLDIVMPTLSGLDILDRLKRLPEAKRCPVLVISGHEAAAREAVTRGAHGYILKPFLKEEFLAKVLALLGMERRSRRR